MRYRYYVSTATIQQGRKADAGSVARACRRQTSSRAVLDALRKKIAVIRCDSGTTAAAIRRFLKHDRACVSALCSKHARTDLDRWTRRADPSEAPSDIGQTAAGVKMATPNDSGLAHDDEDHRRLVVPFTLSRRISAVARSCLPVHAPHVRPIRSSEQQNLMRSIAQGQAVASTGHRCRRQQSSSIAEREGRTERMIRMTHVARLSRSQARPARSFTARCRAASAFDASSIRR